MTGSPKRKPSRKRKQPKRKRALTRKQLLDHVTRFYLESQDFNGLPTPEPHPTHPDIATMLARFLPEERRPARPHFTPAPVKALIGDGLVSLNRGDRHPNPHVKAFPPEPIEEQLQKIDEGGLIGCLYPEPKHLEQVVDRSTYVDEPFRLLLALGEPSLDYRAFDLSVLEQYRNDPRYVFNVNDVSGTISVVEAEDGTTPASLDERHHTYLQFGFAYDKDLNRGVAVFLTDLTRLTPEHQKLWQSRLLEGDWSLHPDYFRSSILGQFPEKIPILQAFTEEIRIINEMAQRMGRPQFFRHEFHGGKRPREFMFLLRPTKKALFDFIHLLDKMLSENINLKFFRDDVALEREVPRKDGKVVIERKGSIQVLGDWLGQTLSEADPKPIEDMIKTLREIRRARQKPAHALNDDHFDQKYFQEQRELIRKAYVAVRVIRLIFANHPAAKAVNVPDDLYRGRIRAF